MLLLSYIGTIQQYTVAGLCCCWAIMLQLQYAVAGLYWYNTAVCCCWSLLLLGYNVTIQQYAVVGLYAVAGLNWYNTAVCCCWSMLLLGYNVTTAVCCCWAK